MIQDEIREGVAKIILDWAECKGDAADNYDLSLSILEYLHSKGVVVTIEKREGNSAWGGENVTHILEPLIKEGG